jgi:acetyl esterase
VSSRHLVDAELARYLGQMPEFTLSHDTLPMVRAAMNAGSPLLGEPAMVGEERLVPGRSGEPDVPIILYKPASERLRPALLEIHGGGMVLGSARAMPHTPAAAAERHDAVVVAVDYRLAPETPFPGPLEDCYAALRWLFANADALGVDPARIAVVGASAGGGLAAALAQLVRDRGEFALCGQILTYPMLDHRTGGPDCVWRNPVAGEFGWTAARNQFGWTALRGDYALDDHRIGWFSPALADDLSGLPPAWIGTGSIDLFVDENLDYARRLIAAGVGAEVHVYDGGFHAFNMFRDTQIAQAMTADWHGGIARLLNPRETL